MAGAEAGAGQYSAEEIFDGFARDRDSVEIADSTFVEVRAIGIAGRVSMKDIASKPLDNQFAWLVANGCPTFYGLPPDEIEDRLDPLVLSKLAARIMELSGLGKDAEAQAEKNLESDPSSN